MSTFYGPQNPVEIIVVHQKVIAKKVVVKNFRILNFRNTKG